MGGSAGGVAPQQHEQFDNSTPASARAFGCGLVARRESIVWSFRQFGFQPFDLGRF